MEEIVTAALQEDVQGIAISSYQGGHLEFFKYMVDLLRQRGGAHIQVYGGGGGVIVPAEIRELQAYGVARIYSPEDGQRMGLAGMIGEMVMRCDVDLSPHAPKAVAALECGVDTLLAAEPLGGLRALRAKDVYKRQFLARPHSRLMTSWMAIARRTLSSVGVVMASSSALVCRLLALS